MKVLFILEAGIPEYRNFLFERLAKEKSITDLLILHNGRIYNGSGEYKSKELKFIGNSKLGLHIGVFKYIFKYDVIISSYNLRNLSCWLPMFFKKKWIFWGKGLGSNETTVVKFLRKLTAKKASHLLVYNEVKKKELLNLVDISEKKVTAYNNTIHIYNDELLTKNEKTYFLYFGRIQERKGLLELLQEYSVYTKNINSNNIKRLRFVGNGDYKEFLQKEVDQLNIEEFVDFYSGVYDDKFIKEHFRGAVAYVSPYNVGLGVINSFAYGVPVVTCKKKQVGPEFYYLNSENSFVIDEIEDLNDTLSTLSELDLNDYNNYCYNYYKSNLTSDIMYNNFLNAIMNISNE